MIVYFSIAKKCLWRFSEPLDSIGVNILVWYFNIVVIVYAELEQ